MESHNNVKHLDMLCIDDDDKLINNIQNDKVKLLITKKLEYFNYCTRSSVNEIIRKDREIKKEFIESFDYTYAKLSDSFFNNELSLTIHANSKKSFICSSRDYIRNFPGIVLAIQTFEEELPKEYVIEVDVNESNNNILFKIKIEMQDKLCPP